MSPPVVPAGMMILIALLLACSLVDCHQINDYNCGRLYPAGRGHHARIIGGEESQRGSWPWQVVLTSIVGGDTYRCGGSVINREYVLTSAHCVYDQAKFLEVRIIVAGEHDLNTISHHEQNRRAAGLIVHPSYDESTRENDIALIKLENAFDFTERVSPVCLPEGNYDDLRAGDRAVLAGWGQESGYGHTYAQTLRQVELSVVDCGYGKSSSKICTYNYGRGACFGDTGGPLVSKKGGRYVQYGVSSTIEGSCEGNSFFTRTSAYLDWIAAVIATNSWGSADIE